MREMKFQAWPAPYMLVGRRALGGIGGKGIGPNDPAHPISRKGGVTDVGRENPA